MSSSDTIERSSTDFKIASIFKAGEMVDNIIKSFKGMVSKLDWMDEVS